MKSVVSSQVGRKVDKILKDGYLIRSTKQNDMIEVRNTLSRSCYHLITMSCVRRV